jgi:isoquinoline 1-oxidoreductase subunit beta
MILAWRSRVTFKCVDDNRPACLPPPGTALSNHSHPVNVGARVFSGQLEDVHRPRLAQHGMYRPYFYFRFAAGLDAQGQPVAWKNRLVGSSVVARWAPALLKNGVDRDTVQCVAEPPYATIR